MNSAWSLQKTQILSRNSSARRRIDRHNNSRQVWRCRLSRGVDDAVAPQRARGVLEQFGIELLPAEARPFVFADDLVEEPGCQIGAIFVGRAPRYRNITAFTGRSEEHTSEL